MKDTVGMLLREVWKAKGNPVCSHTELSLERSFSGVLTGAYVCTRCGALTHNRSVGTMGNTHASEEGG